MIDFIDNDHREMHEVLLQRGFTFEQDSKPLPSSSKWGFVYRNSELDLVIFCESPCIYIGAAYTSSGESCHSLYGKSFDEINKYFTDKDTTVTIQGITPEASMGGTFYDVTSENREDIKITAPETYPNTWDTYAAAALNGLLSYGSLQSVDAGGDLAKFAAELADNLMSERAKRNG